MIVPRIHPGRKYVESQFSHLKTYIYIYIYLLTQHNDIKCSLHVIDVHFDHIHLCATTQNALVIDGPKILFPMLDQPSLYDPLNPEEKFLILSSMLIKPTNC